MTETVVGHFPDVASARAAQRVLARHGFRHQEIVTLLPVDEAEAESDPDGDWHAAFVGAAVGGIIGLLAGLTLSLSPGVAPIVTSPSLLAAGPWVADAVAASVYALIGMVVGGTFGVIVALGVPESAPPAWAERESLGSTLLVLRLQGSYVDEACRLLKRHGADIFAQPARQSTVSRPGSRAPASPLA